MAVGCGVLLVTCHANEPRILTQRLVGYVALSLLLIAPWLLYVQLVEGVPEYFASALRFVAAEGRRTATRPLPPAFLLLTAIPIAGLIATVGGRARLGRPHLAAASAMLLALDIVHLRDVPAARIPDVIAPTAVVASAIAGRYLSSRGMNRLATIAVFVMLLAGATYIARRSDALPTPLEIAGRFGQITGRLRAVSPEITPNPSIAPVIAYLSRCTRPDERIFVAGFGPEIPALAHRPFAGGLPSWIPGTTTTVRMSHAQSAD